LDLRHSPINARKTKPNKKLKHMCEVNGINLDIKASIKEVDCVVVCTKNLGPGENKPKNLSAELSPMKHFFV